MTGSLAGLLVANGLYLVIGVALLPLLRVARTRSELAGRLGLGYIVGVGAMGALSAHLALIGVPVGITELVVVAVVVGAFAVRRVRASPQGPSDTRSPVGGVEVASRVIGIAAFVARARGAWRTRCTRSRCGRSSSGTAGRSGR